jgi:hypothetical protein
MTLNPVDSVFEEGVVDSYNHNGFLNNASNNATAKNPHALIFMKEISGI